jgi:F-type H+-transporting ATPase subunit b
MYTPLLTLMSKRNEYITNNLSEANNFLAQATDIMTDYEIELAKARNKAKVEISTLQKLYKNIIETELRISQKTIDKFLIEVMNSFQTKKDKVIFSMENDIEVLSIQIISKLLA